MKNAKNLNPGPGYVNNPNYIVNYEYSPKRIRVVYKNEVILPIKISIKEVGIDLTGMSLLVNNLKSLLIVSPMFLL